MLICRQEVAGVDGGHSSWVLCMLGWRHFGCWERSKPLPPPPRKAHCCGIAFLSSEFLKCPNVHWANAKRSYRLFCLSEAVFIFYCLLENQAWEFCHVVLGCNGIKADLRTSFFYFRVLVVILVFHLRLAMWYLGKNLLQLLNQSQHFY